MKRYFHVETTLFSDFMESLRQRVLLVTQQHIEKSKGTQQSNAKLERNRALSTVTKDLIPISVPIAQIFAPGML